MIKHKLKAALIHLAISSLIVGSFLVVALSIWYPEPFFGISGLATILLMMVAVDLILGPLLTFVVFKPKKHTLKFDLAVIAAIQLSALAYGVNTVYEAHPLYVAYAIDRFTPINANEVSPEQAKYKELQKSRLSGPMLVYVDKPTDPAELSKVTMEALSGKADLDARPEYYAPLAQRTQELLKNSIDLTPYIQQSKNQKALDDFLQKHGKTSADYAFFPLIGKEKDVFWAFSRETGQPVDTLDINPWEINKVAASK